MFNTTTTLGATNQKNLELRVRGHCRKRGVIISYVKAFQLLSNCANANCNLTVNESDLWKVESNTFWPEYVTVIHQGGYMSLLKYTVFINSYLDQLKRSTLCCSLFTTPSMPVG